jgi:hypothetical protein
MEPNYRSVYATFIPKSLITFSDRWSVYFVGFYPFVPPIKLFRNNLPILSHAARPPEFFINPANFCHDNSQSCGRSISKPAENQRACLALELHSHWSATQTIMGNRLGEGRNMVCPDNTGTPGASRKFFLFASALLCFALLFSNHLFAQSDDWKRFHQQALVLQAKSDYMGATEMAQKALEFT